jgi:hypothetical protein
MTPPLAPFAAERYLRDLRDCTAGAPPGTPRELAWLWACAALDVRCDNILIRSLSLPPTSRYSKPSTASTATAAGSFRPITSLCALPEAAAS